MDLDDFRTILSNSRVNVWEFINAAITVASLDHGHELKDRRDRIVEQLYTSSASRCLNCDVDSQRRTNVQNNNYKASIEKEDIHERQKVGSPATPQSIHRDDDDEEEQDPYGGLFDDEETKILRIKESLEDPEQSEDSVVELLQSLADMDITFKALKETDIGRHVNRLRKNPSNEVRRLVKLLVRKWKDLVDEWVKLNTPDELASSSLLADGDSPLQSLPTRNTQNGHHQIPDFAYSPNPHNGSSGSDKNNSEPEPKAKEIPRRDAPAKPPHYTPVAAPSPPPPKRQQKESNIDLERLASARKRLHENYQEAQNAKRQRTIQVMDIHEIPKPKNTFFAKNKGGSQGRHSWIVESDLPSGESVFHRCRDYTPEFTTDQIFKGRDEMLDWVRKVGRQNGIVVVIKRSANLKGGKLPKCILGCERGGKYEPPRYLSEGQPLQRNTGTKKCGCPFELRGLAIPPYGVMWGLLVKCGFHNHETAEYLDGREYSSGLKPVEKHLDGHE